ncbi:hypothetical protein [Paraburkholderia humisilvae]|uniref:hypothetical protein n=1 Tax=Paraburkholderia humisilvae TaxID=627669 RepID=UPI0015830D8C|nr:hypothetical protein [Paraburkholderia humisilvae]
MTAYVAGAIMFGKRARRFPIGFVLSVLFVGPWWVAVSGGMMAHLVAVIIESLCRREKPPEGLIFAAGAACLVLTFGFDLTMKHAADDLITAIDQSDDAAWARISGSGKAGQMVAAHYKPCVDEKTVVTQRYGRLATTTLEPKNEPNRCETDVIALAKVEGGDGFARDVAAVIDNLPNSLQLSPDAQAKLDSLTNDTAGS